MKRKSAVKKAVIVIFVAVFLLVTLMYAVPSVENKLCRNSNNPEKFENLNSWMSSLDDDLTLNKINIPGTHDSATQYVQLALFFEMSVLEHKGAT